LTMIADEGALENICKDVISKNSKAVEDYKKGEQKSLMFLVGQVMRASKGTASAQVVQELLKSLLK